MCLHRTAAGFHSIAERKAPPSRTQNTQSMQHAGSSGRPCNDRPMAVCQGQVHARHLVLRHSHSSGMAASLAPGHSTNSNGISQCAECTGAVRKSLFSYIAGPRSDQQN